MAGHGRASSTLHLQPQNDPTEGGDDRNFASLPAPPKSRPRCVCMERGQRQLATTRVDRCQQAQIGQAGRAGRATCRCDSACVTKLACQPGQVKSPSLTRARSWKWCCLVDRCPVGCLSVCVDLDLREVGRLGGRTRPLTSESTHVDKPGQATKEMKDGLVFWESRAVQQPQRSDIDGVVSTDLLFRAQDDALPN